MNILKRFYKTISPEINRFPAVVFSAIVSSVIFGFYYLGSSLFAGHHLFLISLTKASFFSVPFSIFISLLVEYIFTDRLDEERVRKISLASQATGLVLCYFPFYFFCRLDSPRFWVAYVCLIFAMLVMCIFFLTRIQKFEEIIPNIVNSWLIAAIETGCVILGILTILWAVDSLLFHVDDRAFTVGIVAACLIVFVNFFLAYSTKQSGTFEIPKSFRVIVKTILFSLYLVLIGVLYIYLIKSLFQKTLPRGRINWFVSFATVFYLFFQLTLKKFQDDKIVALFYKNGHLFLIPLVVIQCVSFGIRVSAYGFTMSRYASLLYIIFSIIVLILASIKSGKLMKFVFPVFSAFLILASVTPLNLVDVPRRDQIYRIEKIYKAHDMFSKDKLNTDGARTKFSDSEKAVICSAYDFLINETKLPKWARNFETQSFSKIFGFEHPRLSLVGGKENSIYFECPLMQLDVSEYSVLHSILKMDVHTDSEKIIVTDSSGAEYDLTEFILPLFSDSDFSNQKTDGNPIIISLGKNADVIITYMHITSRENKFTGNSTLRGFIAKKNE